jgi:hypothetical protein
MSDAKQGELPSERFHALMAELEDQKTGEAVGNALFDLAVEQSKKTGERLPTPEEVMNGVRWAMLLQVLDERLGPAPSLPSAMISPEPGPEHDGVIGSRGTPAVAAGANGPPPPDREKQP